MHKGVVHIVDDDAAVRDALCLMLSASGFAVQTYSGAQAFLSAVPAGVGCVLTDINMPGIDGLEMQRRLRAQGVRLPVIVMTGRGDVAGAVRAMKTGAIDFLEKPLVEAALLDAVIRALRQSELWHLTDQEAANAQMRLASLTRRETEIFHLLAAGQPTKTIANQLGSSPRTVEVHRARIMEKLAASGIADLVRLSLAAGSCDVRV